MTFADTGALFALLVRGDAYHDRARKWFASGKGSERLVTTDYVLDELLTLLRVRGEFARARVSARWVFSGRLARLHWVDDSDVRRASEVFDEFGDKMWSFTDCVSFAVIERLEIQKAFAFDDHFRQFGSVELVC